MSLSGWVLQCYKDKQVGTGAPQGGNTLQRLYLVSLSDFILGSCGRDTKNLVIVGEGGHGRDERALYVLSLSAGAQSHRIVPRVYIRSRDVTLRLRRVASRAPHKCALGVAGHPPSHQVSRLAAMFTISMVGRNTSVSTRVCSTGADDISSPSYSMRQSIVQLLRGRCKANACAVISTFCGAGTERNAAIATCCSTQCPAERVRVQVRAGQQNQTNGNSGLAERNCGRQYTERR